jgi:hypothetical protein
MRAWDELDPSTMAELLSEVGAMLAAFSSDWPPIRIEGQVVDDLGELVTRVRALPEKSFGDPVAVRLVGDKEPPELVPPGRFDPGESLAEPIVLGHSPSARIWLPRS